MWALGLDSSGPVPYSRAHELRGVGCTYGAGERGPVNKGEPDNPGGAESHVVGVPPEEKGSRGLRVC